MKKTLRLLMLLALGVFAAGGSALAETTTKSWNFSDWTEETITDTKTVDGLTVIGSVTIDANNHTVDGVQYTRRLKTGGRSSGTARLLKFEVSGKCTIKFIARSSNENDTRTVYLCNGAYSTENYLTTVSVAPGNATIGTYNYTGEAGTIVIGADGGTNFYYIEVVEDSAPLETFVTFRDASSQTATVLQDRITWNPIVRRSDNNGALNSVNDITKDDIEIVLNNNTAISSYILTPKQTNGNNGFSLILYLTKTAGAVTTVTIKFKGKENVYLPSEVTQSLTITKAPQELSFAEDSKTIDWSSGATVTNALTVNPSDASITYTSSNTDIATVASNGTVSVLNPGSVTITATAAATDTYEKATASYNLTINPTGADYTVSFDQSAASIPLGNNFNNLLTCSDPSIVWAFKSSDENIATAESFVDHNSVLYGHAISMNVGSCTITAYPTNNGGKPYHTVSFELTVTKGNFDMYFDPESGLVNAGATITPHVNFPTVLKSHITSITATSSDPSVAVVPSNLFVEPYFNNQGQQVDAIYPVITGVSEGTATITVTFKSNSYEDKTATYTVTVTASDALNFAWYDMLPITMYEKDFIGMPLVKGTTSGNNSYSAPNSYKYVYGIKSDGTVEYNRLEYLPGEGVPDYYIESTGDGGEAYIFLIGHQNTRMRKLFIYGKKAGTVRLVAADPNQDDPDGFHSKKITRIITILKNDNIVNEFNEQLANMTLPYTWDFTKAADLSDLNNRYWVDDNRYEYQDNQIANGTAVLTTKNYYYMNMGNSFNYNWASDVQDPTSYLENSYMRVANGNGQYYGNEKFKYIVGNNALMPCFAGIKVGFGNGATGYWNSKSDKIRLFKPGKGSKGYLGVNGGHHYFLLPVPEAKATQKMATDQKIKMYLKGYQGEAKTMGVFFYDANGNNITGQFDGAEDAPTNVASALYGTEKWIPFDFFGGDSKIVGIDFDLAKGVKHVKLALIDCSIYWIAYSTESKTLPAAGEGWGTYSYPWDLDIDKTYETEQGAKVYTSNSVSNTTVNLTEMSIVKAGEGMVLQGEAGKAYHFIATGHNTGDYSCTTTSQAGSEVSGNRLIGTCEETIPLAGFGGQYEFDCDLDYILAPAGYNWKTGERLEGMGVGFYVADANASVPQFSAYIHLTQQEIAANNQGFFSFEEMETDGVKEINTNVGKFNDGKIYNLNGVQVDNPTKKGIYIVNGKKVLIK